MKVLVTGASGQLGYDIIKYLKSKKIDCFGPNRASLEITNFKQTEDIIRSYSPDIVIHCAAFTNVDQAELSADECMLVNAKSTINIANVCNELGAKIVYISTDYVFSGEEAGPYEIDSATSPISVYGFSKLVGEKEVIQRVKEHFIIRTSWAYGTNGKNFVTTMLNLGRNLESVDVVSDQIGSPTYTHDLSIIISELMQTDRYGIYHVTNEGFCSWAEFAEQIFEYAGYKTKVNSISSEKYKRIAKRPKNSMLSKQNIEDNGFRRLPEWRDALRRYLTEIGVEVEQMNCYSKEDGG